jgi:aspartate ammonia-lyase
MSDRATRIEHDLLGDRRVPADAYYGVHTLRAIENFPITGTPISIYPDLIQALACIQQAAARTNSKLKPETLTKPQPVSVVREYRTCLQAGLCRLPTRSSRH